MNLWSIYIHILVYPAKYEPDFLKIKWKFPSATHEFSSHCYFAAHALFIHSTLFIWLPLNCYKRLHVSSRQHPEYSLHILTFILFLIHKPISWSANVLCYFSKGKLLGNPQKWRHMLMLQQIMKAFLKRLHRIHYSPSAKFIQISIRDGFTFILGISSKRITVGWL